MRLRAVLLPLAPLAFSLCFGGLTGCSKDEPPKPKAAPITPEPIGSDVVYNSFFDDKAAPQPTSVVVAAGDAGPTDTALGGASKAKVLEPGAEPRARLSYNFAIGKTRTVTNTIKLEVGADPQGGQAPPQPPIRYSFTATPKTHNSATNSTHFELKIASLEVVIPPGANVPPEMAAQKKALESAVAGITASFDASSQGDLDEVKFQDDKVPPQAAELLQLVAAAFEIILVPLPADPVGIGGKWQTTMTKPGKGTSTMTVTLLAKSDTGATLKVDSTVNTPPQAISDPRIPAGTTVEVKGTGSFTIDIRYDGVSAKANGAQTIDRVIKVPANPPQSPTPQTEKDTQKIIQDLSSK